MAPSRACSVGLLLLPTVLLLSLPAGVGSQRRQCCYSPEGAEADAECYQSCRQLEMEEEALAGSGASLVQLRASGRGLKGVASESEAQPAAREKQRSEIECKDIPGYNQTCMIRNAYLEPDHGDVVTLLVLEDQQVPSSLLQSWGGPDVPFRLNVKRFASLDALNAQAERLKPRRKTGLSLLFSASWHHNWAHAIFDGLYPAFVGLAKFRRHKEPFLPVVCLSNQTAKFDCKDPSVQAWRLDCAMEEAFRLFGSMGDDQGQLEKRMLPLRLKLGDQPVSTDPNPDWLVLDELVVGSGHGGQYMSVSSLPGTQVNSVAQDEDVLLAFRERLYQAHGLDPPPRRSRSNEGRDPEAPLKVLVTDNERHTPELLSALHAVANASSLAVGGVANTTRNPRSRLELSFVSWTDLQPWRQQLNLLREVDILVSGIGTALFYSLLLPDGAATVNLGWNRPLGFWGGNGNVDAPGTGHPGFPSYGEEFLGMSNHRTRMFYLPLDQVRRGPQTSELAVLLENAEAVLRSGFEIPVASPEENLGIFGKILLDLQRESEDSFRGLAGLSEIKGNGTAWASKDRAYEELYCHSRATGQASATDVVYEQVTVMEVTHPCHIDVQLLRQLKVKHGLKEALGVTAECECIVCEACGLS